MFGRKQSGDPLERADPLLNPLLDARKSERAAEIERLLARAAPLAARILERQSLSPADREEIAAVVSYRLFRRLDGIASGAQPVIESFDDYVSRLTVNSVNDHLRANFPERTRLKNQLRHLLTQDGAFALWPTTAGTVAGLARWRGRTDALDEGDLEAVSVSPPAPGGGGLKPALQELFERLDRPVRFDAIVTLFDDAREPAAAAAEVFESGYDRQDLLRAMWQEVLQLPPQQRTALLLNLRDPEGSDVITLFIVTGVATAADLAAALGLTELQLAELWLELPLGDNAIADRLGIDRQRVINLRKSARERLARRLHRAPGKKR